MQDRTVDANSPVNQRPILLLLERAREIYALNPAALKVTQSSPRRLRQDYVGEHLVDQDGRLYVIKNIVTQGVYGNTFGRRLINRLVGAYSIATEIDELPRPTLADLKSLVSRFIRYDADSDNPNLTTSDSPEEVLRRIDESRTVEQIFSAVNVPKLEDCLDVL